MVVQARAKLPVDIETSWMLPSWSTRSKCACNAVAPAFYLDAGVVYILVVGAAITMA